MTLSKNKKPMNDFIYQSIMNEYCVSPFMYMEDHKIQKAVAMSNLSSSKALLDGLAQFQGPGAKIK